VSTPFISKYAKIISIEEVDMKFKKVLKEKVLNETIDPDKDWREIYPGEGETDKLDPPWPSDISDEDTEKDRTRRRRDVFYKNGHMKSRTWYVGDMANPDGCLKLWFPNGKLRLRCRYENGMRSHDYKEWYPDGSIKEHSFWNKNEPHGEFKQWGPNGELRVHKFFQNGDEIKVVKFLSYKKGYALGGNGQFYPDHTDPTKEISSEEYSIGYANPPKWKGRE
jgi:antitoxin component YwqK of YwqJK toxin-antitoxin module